MRLLVEVRRRQGGRGSPSPCKTIDAAREPWVGLDATTKDMRDWGGVPT